MVNWIDILSTWAKWLEPFATLTTLALALSYLSEKDERPISTKIFKFSALSLLFTIAMEILVFQFDINATESTYPSPYPFIGTLAFAIGTLTLFLGIVFYTFKDFGIGIALNIKPELGFLKNPFTDTESFENNITVPPDKKIILYFALKVKSHLKEYINPLIWIYFDKEFEISYKIDYEKLFFGKKLTILKKNDTLIKIEGKLYRKQLNPLVFPIIVKTPSSEDKYDISSEFTSENLKYNIIPKKIIINVKKGISDKSFNYEKFVPRN